MEAFDEMSISELMVRAEALCDEDSPSYSPDIAADCWERAAALGSMDALANLADCYFLGKGRPEDETRALGMYQRVLDATDNASCAYQIGRMYRMGWGASCDFDKAIESFKRAWKLGNVQAANDMGAMYLSKAGSTQDPADVEEGFKWFQRASSKGDDYGTYRMALLYAFGDYGMSKDAKRAYDLLMRAKRDSRALGYLVSSNGLNIAGNEQYRDLLSEAEARAEEDQDAELYEALGRAYEGKTRLDSDPAKAAFYYGRSLALGNGFAGYLLGLNCWKGWSGFEVNLESAECNLLKGADLGCSQAMSSLGDLYKEKARESWPHDPEWLKRSFEWYDRAYRANGDAWTALHAGEVAVEVGDIALYERAAECLFAASQEDIYWAYVKLAKLSMDESLPTFNPERARRALEKARIEEIVEYKTGEVDYLTGRMFEKGIGYPAAANQAVEFYLKAAEKGCEDAKESLKRFKKGLFGWKRIS
ncbi:tetratricopeptide repeat protein [Arabiibacter massiliensis]|uniref:tetratricopeptide repeat protein n=1 Tax=Arabiibacter massiliensis TaxID=1870985 RepID=UPI00155AF0C2|nr:SEL1-like repeat protein [Arabiibacter massiliensis]